MYVTQSLHRILQQCPDMPLTIFADRQRTVRQSADRIARLAGALHALGVQRDDRVAFLGLNSDRYHEYFYAVPWADAAVNPVNIRWSPAEIAYRYGIPKPRCCWSTTRLPRPCHRFVPRARSCRRSSTAVTDHARREWSTTKGSSRTRSQSRTRGAAETRFSA